ncbi:hypothetical protein [Nocardia sp. NPDC051981]|uniref:hypothetical protein n=1 Tax=Nocardia sp. NPDC051981 TaxID=3155417 RepID=UPI003449043D
MRFPTLGVRTRILAIALVPSVALAAIGLGVAGTLIDRSHQARTWADEMRAGIVPTRELIEAVQAERQLNSGAIRSRYWNWCGPRSARPPTTPGSRPAACLRLSLPAGPSPTSSTCWPS